MKTKLTLILLAHNEEKTILDDIKNIHKIILKKIKNTEFIIFQDGSIDKTHKIISSVKKNIILTTFIQLKDWEFIKLFY